MGSRSFTKFTEIQLWMMGTCWNWIAAGVLLSDGLQALPSRVKARRLWDRFRTIQPFQC